MRLGTAALTLAATLTVVGLASADDAPTGNWFTNWFARPAAKTPEPAAKDDAPKLPPSNRKKLKADLDRRQEVCLRLQEIAIDAGDEELMKLAGDLDRRAWETYVAAKNRGRAPESTVKGARE